LDFSLIVILKKISKKFKMANFVNTPCDGKIVKLSGKITDYRCTSMSASFVYSQDGQYKMGAIAVAAALAGMSGQAASVAGYTSALEEPAEYLEFNLNGDLVKGWVWRSPFKEGDVVDIAAEWRRDHYEAYGITRPTDRIIALYPHCSRSRWQHIKVSIKLWVIWNILFFGISALGATFLFEKEILQEPAFLSIAGFIALMWILMFVSLSTKYMPFVRLSEKVFIALDLPNAENLDLIKLSKQSRSAEDPPEFGKFYFRY
jgi:hypothetical protein